MKKRHHKTHIDHHSDRSHTMHRHYTHEDGSTSKESSAHPDLDAIHDALQQHLGTPNPGEAEADRGEHGIPEEHATPAGLPMTPPPPGGAPGGAAPAAGI